LVDGQSARKKGDLVFVDPPASPIFELARNRGYLDVGYSLAGSCALIKRLAATAGDRVTINGAGVEVNWVRLANSKPLLLTQPDGRYSLTFLLITFRCLARSC
jgi:type IV secretory pathway protease TraF